MAQFNEYPKLMKHPQFAAAVWKKLEGKGVGLFEPDTVMVSPERFSDVTVTNLEQEKFYAARGYRPNNIGDSEMYEQAILESAPVDGYKYHEYPKWKYHAFEIPKVVNSRAEDKELGDEWSDAPIIAMEDDLVEDQKPGPEAPKAQPKAEAPKRGRKPKMVHA